MENLGFVLEVHHFQKLVEQYRDTANSPIEQSKQIMQLAEKIFSEYIIEGVSSQVNLPCHLRKRIIQIYNNSSYHQQQQQNRIPLDSLSTTLSEDMLRIFDAAEISVMGMMEQDTFIRFRCSKRYK